MLPYICFVLEGLLENKTKNERMNEWKKEHSKKTWPSFFSFHGKEEPQELKKNLIKPENNVLS